MADRKRRDKGRTGLIDGQEEEGPGEDRTNWWLSAHRKEGPNPFIPGGNSKYKTTIQVIHEKHFFYYEKTGFFHSVQKCSFEFWLYFFAEQDRVEYWKNIFAEEPEHSLTHQCQKLVIHQLFLYRLLEFKSVGIFEIYFFVSEIRHFLFSVF